MVDSRSAKIKVAPVILIFLLVLVSSTCESTSLFFDDSYVEVLEKLSSNLERLPSFRLVSYDVYHDVFSQKNFDCHNPIFSNSVSGRQERPLQNILTFIHFLSIFYF